MGKLNFHELRGEAFGILMSLGEYVGGSVEIKWDGGTCTGALHDRECNDRE
jgi:hypothetical protein